MIALIVGLALVLFLLVITTGPTLMVYGFPIKEDELDVYLSKYLPTSELNPFDKNIIGNMPAYVSKVSLDLFFKWQVSGHGVIWRWSKWTKKLDDRVSASGLSDL